MGAISADDKTHPITVHNKLVWKWDSYDTAINQQQLNNSLLNKRSSLYEKI